MGRGSDREEGKRDREEGRRDGEEGRRDWKLFSRYFYFSNRLVSYTIISKRFLAVINIYAHLLKSICQ